MPQSHGIPGWIVLTYDETTPVCLFVTNRHAERLPLIADERICGDTFFRVERLSKYEFLVADIWVYNSNCVFACSTFAQRYEWLKELLETFTYHVKGTVHLQHKSTYLETPKGYEAYTDEIGAVGTYVEDGILCTVKRLPIPDCYDIDGKYVRVPDLKTSVYLRSKGDIFTCKCTPHDDESWDVAENIPELE